MAFRESPSQQAARQARAAFFAGAPPNEPASSPGSAIGESPSQVSRRNFLAGFFTTKPLAETSAGKPRVVPAPSPVHRGAKKTPTIHQANGGTLIVKDCEGTELFRIKKLAGIDGEQELRAGCDDSSSGSL